LLALWRFPESSAFPTIASAPEITSPPRPPQPVAVLQLDRIDGYFVEATYCVLAALTKKKAKMAKVR
jgi:hypothetical protein